MNIKKIIFISALLLLTSCISSTYYLGQFDIYTDNNAHSFKPDAVNKIKQAALANSLKFDENASNEDTLSFFGPPYHYIQFFFDDKTKPDSLVIRLKYDGRLASRSSTDRIYFNLIRQIDSLYKGKIKYSLIDKR